MADALDRARHFVLGCSDLVVAVDHKPLLKLFGDRCLEDIPNPRLRNLKERTLRYRFRMAYIPGIRNQTSDALSRHPSDHRSDCTSRTTSSHQAATAVVGPAPHPTPCTLCTARPAHFKRGMVSPSHCAAPSQQHRLAGNSCKSPQQKTQRCRTSWQQSRRGRQAPKTYSHQAYFNILGDLTIIDDVVCYGDRIVIPQSLRQQCLRALHVAHQGTSGMMARAASSMYWPGMTSDINTTRAHCAECNGNAPSQPHLPPTTPETPDRPFSSICADYFHHAGSCYLVVVD